MTFRTLFIACLLCISFSAKAGIPQDFFLPEDTLANAQALSASICATEGCHPPTIYWNSVLTLPCTTLGPYWVVFEPSGPYGVQLLSAPAQALLKPFSTLDADGCFNID